MELRKNQLPNFNVQMCVIYIFVLYGNSVKKLIKNKNGRKRTRDEWEEGKHEAKNQRHVERTRILLHLRIQ